VSEVDIDPAAHGAKVLERLREQPGGPELLELARRHADAFLVGGAVRDLLLDGVPRELDVLLVSEQGPGHTAAIFARELASSLNVLAGEDVTSVNEHERFITAGVKWDGGTIDIAMARRERYPTPGALPEVELASIVEDLLRRDFSINAIAVGLGGGSRGELRQVPGALEDLRDGRIRVLHDASFEDDPTRLLRLARYRARLGFAVAEHTAELASQALSAGALDTVSGARIGAELRLALAEAQAPRTLEAMRELGVLAAVHPRLRHDSALVARALELLPADGSRESLLLAALVLPLTLRADGSPRVEAGALLDRLEFSQGERDRAVAAATAAVRLHEVLPRCERPADLYVAASRDPIEGVALAGALDGAADSARRWLEEVRHVRLAIDGRDLLAEGVPQGPEIGRRLHETLLLRLDGKLGEGRDAELEAARELS
jgi:tRNA nucleotidyltransferase (CCA-adding enzyme)